MQLNGYCKNNSWRHVTQKDMNLQIYTVASENIQTPSLYCAGQTDCVAVNILLSLIFLSWSALSDLMSVSVTQSLLSEVLSHPQLCGGTGTDTSVGKMTSSLFISPTSDSFWLKLSMRLSGLHSLRSSSVSFPFHQGHRAVNSDSSETHWTKCFHPPVFMCILNSVSDVVSKYWCPWSMRLKRHTNTWNKQKWKRFPHDFSIIWAL